MSASATVLKLSADPTPVAANSVDSTALAKLLAELNSHSLALVPYQPAGRQAEPSRVMASLSLESILLWVLTTVLLAAVFSTLTIKFLVPEREPPTVVQAPSRESGEQAALIGKQQREVSDLADSVSRLTSALVSSSTRVSRLEAGQAQLLSRKEPVVQSSPANSRSLASDLTPAAVPTAAEAEGAHHHDSLTGLDMIPGAMEHHKVNGTMDYWLARRAEGSNIRMIKVRPFAPSPLGAWVHNLEDGQDYILTPAGGWMRGGSAY